jgi:hypothetical protein
MARQVFISMAIRNAISEDFLPPSKPLDSTQGRILHLEPPNSCSMEPRRKCGGRS